jgi:hypothetical protein
MPSRLQDLWNARMFVSDEVLLDVSFAVARERLAWLSESGALLGTSADAYGPGQIQEIIRPPSLGSIADHREDEAFRGGRHRLRLISTGRVAPSLAAVPAGRTGKAESRPSKGHYSAGTAHRRSSHLVSRANSARTNDKARVYSELPLTPGPGRRPQDTVVSYLISARRVRAWAQSQPGRLAEELPGSSSAR